MYFFIKLLVTISWVAATLCSAIIKNETDIIDPNKDMYVIHAMVYQVGILTNKSNEGASNMTGNEEAVTFYHTNGTDIDLSNIPAPFLTNITAESMVGVAPAQDHGNQPAATPWNQFKKLASLDQTSAIPHDTTGARNIRSISDTKVPDLSESNLNAGVLDVNNSKKYESGDRVKIEKGAVVIPEQAGVKSIVIPPLISFNNNLSDIPVPIPNTSVVRYAKVNTLVRAP